MDSINKQQPDDSYQDLRGAEGLKKIKELAEKKTCFFLTDIETGKPVSVRPMGVQQIDDEGNLWFLSAKDSHKNQDVKQDPHVHLLFQGSDYSDFLNIYGTTTVSDDKAKIKELWEPMMKNWFTEGIDDPRISVIKVTPETGYYWDTKNGTIVNMVKMAVGAIMGKTTSDSVEGKVTV